MCVGLSAKVVAVDKDTAIVDASGAKRSVSSLLQDLEVGDYVVHEFNGIGQFLGFETMEVDGVHRDFMKIAYAGGDYL